MTKEIPDIEKYIEIKRVATLLGESTINIINEQGVKSFADIVNVYQVLFVNILGTFKDLSGDPNFSKNILKNLLDHVEKND